MEVANIQAAGFVGNAWVKTFVTPMSLLGSVLSIIKLSFYRLILLASDHILGILCEESKKVKRSNKSGLFCSFRNLRLKPTKVSAQRMLILD